MKKILLPTDFSNNSLNAIRYAVQLFKDQECNFILLNTFTPVVYKVEYMEVGAAQFGLLDSMKEASMKGLEVVLQKIESEFNNPKHTFSKKTAFNMLSSEIEDLYNKKEMDLIVMGTQGATGLKEILFGSNTVHVIKSTKCPLLAIPNDFSFVTPSELLFPSDYEIDFQEKQLQTLKTIAELYQSKLSFLHVSHQKELSSTQEENRQILAYYFKDMMSSFRTANNENIVDAIMQFQSDNNINLLAMISNKKSFFENLFFRSKINKIGFRLNIPFLVIPT